MLDDSPGLGIRRVLRAFLPSRAGPRKRAQARPIVSPGSRRPQAIAGRQEAGCLQPIGSPAPIGPWSAVTPAPGSSRARL